MCFGCCVLLDQDLLYKNKALSSFYRFIFWLPWSPVVHNTLAFVLEKSNGLRIKEAGWISKWTLTYNPGACHTCPWVSGLHTPIKAEKAEKAFGAWAGYKFINKFTLSIAGICVLWGSWCIYYIGQWNQKQVIVTQKVTRSNSAAWFPRFLPVFNLWIRNGHSSTKKQVWCTAGVMLWM